MRLVEYRIPLPTSVEDYQVGLLYTVGALSREKTNSDTSVKVVVNEPFENERGRGQYTHKVFHPGSYVPGFLLSLFPADYFTLHEKAWNCYPYCRTEYSSPGLGERFSIVMESIHLPDDGSTENAHNLSPQQLAQRKVHKINIATEPSPDPKVIWDPRSFTSNRAGCGPLGENWIESAQPIMCCYKLATIKCEVPLLTSKIESLVEHKQHEMLLDFAIQCICRLDEWFGMSMDDIRKFEDQIKEELDEKLAALGHN